MMAMMERMPLMMMMTGPKQDDALALEVYDGQSNKNKGFLVKGLLGIE